MINTIDDSFKHGSNFDIGNFCVIEEDVVVGNNVTIGNNVVIKSGCRIGNGTQIDHFVLLKNNTIIGEDTFVDSYFRSSGDNLIGNNVTLRFGSTIARFVTVKDGAFIAPNVMTIYSRHTGEKVPGTVIGKNAHIGTAAVLGPGVKIGDNVVIGSQAFVSKDCLEEGIYVGVPAKRIKKL